MVVNKNTTLQKKNTLVILYLSHIETKELHVTRNLNKEYSSDIRITDEGLSIH